VEGISVERLGERRYSLAGELDIATAPSLDELRRDDDFVPGNDVVLELSDLTFIDSQGVRTLLGLAASLQPGGRLILHAPSTAAAKVFELIRLRDIENVELT
jgi:anti-anti-sigma factor